MTICFSQNRVCGLASFSAFLVKAGLLSAQAEGNLKGSNSGNDQPGTKGDRGSERCGAFG
jgi:hypothetical protein